jgi:2-aminobenzoate-CoA ligase
MTDSFARDNLPPPGSWPDLIFARPELQYPARLNCVSVLLDAWTHRGHADQPCLISPTEALTYGQLQALVNRIAHVLVHRLDVVPGGRVLLRAANTPMMVACYLAVLKAGAIAVATMPMLRAGELVYPIRKARTALALCDLRLAADLEAARAQAPELARVVYFNSAHADGLEAMIADAPDTFVAADTAADDVCLIGFTSGTTGEPKGTVHFHRDMLAICDGYAGHILRATEADRFIGSPPLAFTFGLGGLVLFPLHAGASVVLLERAGPDELLDAIPRFGATICFTAPTAYRAMLARWPQQGLPSLRRCVSAGEMLPPATFDAWRAATGLTLMDGIGATEMLHIFIASRPEDARAGATGKPVPGYEARVVDAAGQPVPDGVVGRLAVRGPTGCRYLADPRQSAYVQDGWNITGDAYLRDADGYFRFQARADDMIVSSGYNIAGPEVEAALLLHPAVAECAVVGVPDADRGMLVGAYVVLHPGYSPDGVMAGTLQNFVKATIAPYKYPRHVEFRDMLPKTQTGKLQRFRLRQEIVAS